jgi:hypothetical protein
MYRLSPSRSVVVSKAQAGNLRVLHGDREIEADVTAVQLSIWNEGRGVVRADGVLDPLRIVMNPPTKILTASIQKTTRDVTELGLDQASLESGTVPIRFRILEQDDGALVQLVYAGPPSVDISVAGVIEGQRTIEAKGKPQPMSPWAKVGVTLVAGFFLVVIPIIAAVDSYRKRSGAPLVRVRQMMWEGFLFVAVIGGIFGMVAVVAYLWRVFFGSSMGPFQL